MLYVEILVLCKSSSTQSIQRSFGFPCDRLLLGSRLNTYFASNTIKQIRHTPSFNGQ